MPENATNLLIVDQIIKTEKVKWRELTILQPENFKRFADKNYEKLKRSINRNGFSDPFKVWQEKDTVWVIDGVHRILTMKRMETQGWEIPDTFTANFVKCRDKDNAFEKVLIYSSTYTEITQDGLFKALADTKIELPELELTIALPSFDMKAFGEKYFKADFQENISKQKIKDKFQLSYAFTSEEREVVLKAIKLAGSVYKTDNSNQALFKICQSYLST